MSHQASLSADLPYDLDTIETDLKELVPAEFPGRVRRDFAGTSSGDVFVQTKDYNVFIKSSGLQFHGIEMGDVGEWESVESSEVWDYLEENYTEDGESLEYKLSWR